MRCWLLLFCLFCAPISHAQTPKVSVELQQNELLVGQVNTIRVTVLVPTWLTKPLYFNEIEAVNLINVQSNKSAFAYSKQIDGTTWSGVIKEYQVIPMIAGPFKIDLPSIDIYYQSEDATSKKVEITPNAINFIALIPPKAEKLKPLIIAQSLSIDEVIDKPEPLTVGSAITRKVTIKVEASSGLFVPAMLQDMTSDNVKSYTYPAKIKDKLDSRTSVLSSDVTQHQELIILRDKELKLAPITISYYQPSSNSIQTVSLEEHIYQVKPQPLTTPQKIIYILILGISLWLLWLLARYLRPIFIPIYHQLMQSESMLFYRALKSINSEPKQALNNYLNWLNSWQKTFEYNNQPLKHKSVELETLLEQSCYFEQITLDKKPLLKVMRRTLKLTKTQHKYMLNSLNPQRF